MKLIDFATSSFSVRTRGWDPVSQNWVEIVRKVNNQRLRVLISVVALNTHYLELDAYLRYGNES